MNKVDRQDRKERTQRDRCGEGDRGRQRVKDGQTGVKIEMERIRGKKANRHHLSALIFCVPEEKRRYTHTYMKMHLWLT